MHYTRHYLEGTRAERHATAIDDCKEYLGEPAYDRVFNSLVEYAATVPVRKALREMPKYLSLAGIQGLPAYAMSRAAVRTAHSSTTTH